MLFKDNVKFTLGKEQREEVMTEIRKFPISVVFVPEKIRIVKDSNGRPKKVLPPGVNIDLRYTVTNEKGESNEFVWAESVRVVDRKNVYYLTSFMFTGVTVFNEKDIEFVWFLLHCLPVLRYGHNANPNGIHEVMFNLPFVSQEKEVSYNRKLSIVNAKIYSDESEVPTEKLRQIASSLFMPNVKELERIELQFQLGELIKAGNTKYNKEQIVERFLELTEDTDLQKVGSMVQQGFEKGYLVFNEETRKVILKVGDKQEIIVKKVPLNKDFKEMTISNLMADSDNLKFLELGLA